MVRELIGYWIIVLYLAVFFSVFANYRRLKLAHYSISYTLYGTSILEAMVLAKCILIFDTLHFGRRLKNKPLIFSTLYKAAVFPSVHSHSI